MLLAKYILFPWIFTISGNKVPAATIPALHLPTGHLSTYEDTSLTSARCASDTSQCKPHESWHRGDCSPKEALAWATAAVMDTGTEQIEAINRKCDCGPLPSAASEDPAKVKKIHASFLDWVQLMIGFFSRARTPLALFLNLIFHVISWCEWL
jgi:hypothetical protein